MPMRRLANLTAGAILCLLVLSPRPAAADVTGFYGLNVSPWVQQTKGLAVGVTVVAVGVEFEYSSWTEDVAAKKPGLTTFAANVLLQTPISIKGLRIYGTAGAEVYRMVSGADDKLGVGLNVGGGVKITVTGPISIRLDYRIFPLASPIVAGKPQRAYAGLNLAL